MSTALYIAAAIVVGVVLVTLLAVILIAGIYELALGRWGDPRR